MTFTELWNKIGFKVDQQSLDQANNTIKGLSNTARRLLGVIGIGISLTQLNAIAEEFDGIGDRLSYAVGESEKLDETQKAVLESANASRTSLGSFVNQVTKLKQANEKLFPIEDAITFTEYINKLGKAAGYSDGEISDMNNSAMRLVSREKVLEGDIVQMIRRTPALANVLAKSLGVNTDQLQAMAKAGQITGETLKKAVLSSTADIDDAFSNLNYGIGDMLVQVRNRWGVWVDETNKMFNITQGLAKYAYGMFDKLMSGLTKVRNGVQWLADKVGGVNNLLRLVAMTAGIMLAAFKGGKVITFLSNAYKLITGISTKTKLLMLAALAVALIIDDLINFMQGNDSLIGDILSKAGIDADEFREKIRDVFETVKGIFSTVFDFIKTIVQTGLQYIRELWDKWGTAITNLIANVFGGIVDALKAAFSFISEVVRLIVSLLLGDWGGAIDALGGMWKALLSGIITVAGDILKAVGDLVVDIAAQFLGLPEDAVQWGKDIVNGLVNGLKSAASAVGGVISGIAGTVKSFFSLSTPTASTAGAAASTTSSRTVNQTNNFNNTYNGEKAFQKNAAKASSKNAGDAISQLARAVANG